MARERHWIKLLPSQFITSLLIDMGLSNENQLTLVKLMSSYGFKFFRGNCLHIGCYGSKGSTCDLRCLCFADFFLFCLFFVSCWFVLLFKGIHFLVLFNFVCLSPAVCYFCPVLVAQTSAPQSATQGRAKFGGGGV